MASVGTHRITIARRGDGHQSLGPDRSPSGFASRASGPLSRLLVVGEPVLFARRVGLVVLLAVFVDPVTAFAVMALPQHPSWCAARRPIDVPVNPRIA